MKYSLGRRWNLVGPLASIDLGGLDVFYNISTYLFDDMDNGTGPSRCSPRRSGRQSRRQNRPGLLLLAGRGRQAHHRIPQQGPAARAEERRRGCRRCAGVRHKYQGSVTTMTSTEHSTRADMLAHMAAFSRPPTCARSNTRKPSPRPQGHRGEERSVAFRVHGRPRPRRLPVRIPRREPRTASHNHQRVRPAVDHGRG